MTDKVLATLSMAALILFTSVVVVFVRELDLAVVIIICLSIGIYDFWVTLRNKRNGNGASKP